MKTVYLIMTPRTSPSLLKSSSSVLALVSNSLISSIVKFNQSSLEQTSILMLCMVKFHMAINW